MNARPLLESGTDVAKTTVWPRLARAGALIYPLPVADLWVRHSLSVALSLFWGLVITAGFTVALAIGYVAAVMRLTGSSKGAWSLPDTATAETALDPERALRRVQRLADIAFPWVLSTMNEGEGEGERELSLKRRSWWSGRASVTVGAEPKGNGALLRLRAGSKNFVNNGIERAMIARLTAELKGTVTQP